MILLVRTSAHRAGLKSQPGKLMRNATFCAVRAKAGKKTGEVQNCAHAITGKNIGGCDRRVQTALAGVCHPRAVLCKLYRPALSHKPRAVGAMEISPALQRGVSNTNQLFGVP